MQKFTPFLLLAFAVLSASTCFAAFYNKEPDAGVDANSDPMYAIKPTSANANEQ